MTLALDAVALLVPDYDDGIDFFVRTLGFALVEDSDLGGGKRWVLVAAPGGGSRLLLARAVGEQTAAVGRQGGGRVFLFLATDDFAADHARLRAAGVAFAQAPRREPYGRVAVFLDPWGNRWDLVERAAAAP
jgi:catechol 2,3-dioxygenase-like lactoylglutathione lyase family enzyme